MNHKDPGITPSDLVDRPELAALQILDSTVEIVRFALLAAHPDLTDSDPGTTPCDIEALAAEHVLLAAEALQRVIASYRGVIQSGAHWVKLPLPRPSDAAF
jgi:hypothetical protein